MYLSNYLKICFSNKDKRVSVMPVQDKRQTFRQYTTSTTASSELPLSSSPVDSPTEEYVNPNIPKKERNGN